MYVSKWFNFCSKEIKERTWSKKSLNYKQQQIKTTIEPRQVKAIYYEHVDTVEPSLVITSNQRSSKYGPVFDTIIFLQERLFAMITSNQRPNDNFCKIQPLILPLIVVMNNK